MTQATPAQLFERLSAKAHELAQTTTEQRIEKLQALVAATVKARAQIIAASRAELRVHEVDIDGQILMIKSEAEFAIKHLHQWMRNEKIQGSIMTLGKKSYIKYEPKGVVLNLATWNAPFAISFVPLIGAIAAGNSIMLKPSELAPQSAQVIADIVAECFSEDEFAVVQGGPEVAGQVLALPFNHIFFIGGHSVGRLVMKAAAENFASVTLEMGGKNPVIVDKSADIEWAGKKIGWGRVANGGQVCLAPEYALVHASIEREFIASLGKAMKEMYNHDDRGFEQSEYLPRIVNLRHFQRIKALLDDAVAMGAKIEFGGQTNADDLFIAPTVLSGVTESMRIMQEEIFGPIICVIPFKENAEVPTIIRRRPKPLATYIFAKDRSQINWFLNHTTAGSTVINHNVIQSGTNANMPFGGVNASGIGRLGGRYSFLECSNIRAVLEEGPPMGDPHLIFPPYDDKYKKMLAQMLGKGINMPNFVINLINGIVSVSSKIFRR